MDTKIVLSSTPEPIARRGDNMARPSVPANPVAGEAVQMKDLDRLFEAEVDTWALVQLAQKWGL